MRKLFVGGPGRSGTSFVADRLGRHAEVAAFADVELKIFTEKNGLLDLWIALDQTYSPNRAVQALQQFTRFCDGLIGGQFGQQALSRLMPDEDWRAIVARFVGRLTTDGHPGPATATGFFGAAGALVDDLAALAARQPGRQAPARLFLEKTPHALLAMDFLARMAPGACFVHVMRDPRSIANSLGKMGWGPSGAAACCAWVDSYCESWDRALARARAACLPVECLRIEEIACRPEPHARQICRMLAITPDDRLFAGADLATLNAWAGQKPAEDLAFLTARLDRWIRRFGYCLDRVGGIDAAGPDPVAVSADAPRTAAPAGA